MVEGFEWDPGTAATNAEKHGVDFAEAFEVFIDEAALTVPDDHSDEERFATVGTDAVGRVLVVVHCWRGDRIRIISARRATARERKDYEGAR